MKDIQNKSKEFEALSKNKSFNSKYLNTGVGSGESENYFGSEGYKKKRTSWNNMANKALVMDMKKNPLNQRKRKLCLGTIKCLMRRTK